MRRLLATFLLLASLSACGGARIPAPALFPMKTTWVAAGEDVIEPPLALDGTRLFVAGRGGTVRALDAASGTVAWQVDGRPGLLATGEELLLLRQPDGLVWGMDPATGTTRWVADSGIAGALPPVVAGGKVFVAGEGIAALEAATGKALWKIESSPVATAPPALWGPWVLVGESDGTLRCRDVATGASLWTLGRGSPLIAPPVVDDRRRAFLGTTDRRFVGLRLDKKGRERWRWKVGADVQAGAALLEDRVLFTCFDAVLYALNRSNGHMLWRAPLPSRPISGPILAGASVIVACHEDEIVGFDGRTGRALGGLKTTAAIRTPPVLASDRLYLGLRDGSVVALQISLEKQAAPEGPPSPQPRGRRRPGAPPAPTIP